MTPTSPPPASSLNISLGADFDRDGVVEFVEDKKLKRRWTRSFGAVFMNNNDSDEDLGEPDHSDERVNGKSDLRDLAELRVRRLPDLPKGSRVTVRIDAASHGRVRIFERLRSGDFANVPLRKTNNLDGELLRETDLELRIEANSYADGGWKGETTVTVEVHNKEGRNGSDQVRLRVAPFIVPSSICRADTLYIREFIGRNDLMIAQLQAIAPAANCKLHVIPSNAPYPSNNIWMQDTMLLGYSEMPGHRMPVVLRSNRNKPIDQFPKEELLGPDFGWFSCGDFRPSFGAGEKDDEWIDWFGNLEVSPPLPGYPFGRLYYGAGREGTMNPDVIEMLDAQGLQGPALEYDVSWLLIRHVDEIFCFVPSGDPLHPWQVLVPNTLAMIALCEEWQRGGLGEAIMLKPFDERTTVNAVLANTELMTHNRMLQESHITPNNERFVAEMGLRPEDLIQLPMLYHTDGKGFFPDMVNSVLMNGHLLVPAPNGPEVDGVDLLEVDMRSLMARAPLQVHFLDDQQYHRWSGNVHCATNTRRDPYSIPWWTVTRL